MLSNIAVNRDGNGLQLRVDNCRSRPMLWFTIIGYQIRSDETPRFLLTVQIHRMVSYACMI